ncbi:hypothetical protein SAMN05216345_101155 [Cupriavidus sp. YR651]|uniref:hypothetical protein n=1 Tax=Cupriavidus sp. YR651 TaxID=1855315 RepID=UPI0008842FDA|nr:hypothetical protein [Cupriavidus sp. YR651]SDC00978.1 hypothetical protein SAMN05216345_101155 [Cupriavidus sp. YR651]
MPWANIEHAGRTVMSAWLLFHLIGLAMQSLLAAGEIQARPADFSASLPVREALRFPDMMALLRYNAMRAMQALFGIAGLWFRQPSPWLNWACLLPWFGTIALEWLTGARSLALLLDH